MVCKTEWLHKICWGVSKAREEEEFEDKLEVYSFRAQNKRVLGKEAEKKWPVRS